MTTKRELLRLLKTLKKKPRALSPAECDELILLLGGTTRPNHRPEVRIFGKSRQRANWTAIAEVVFSFLENAEQLANCEADLGEMNSPDFLEKEFPNLALTNRAEAECLLGERLATARPNIESRIAGLRPISARNRAEAERMASKWFADRGTKLSVKQIGNRLSVIQKTAGLKRLQLAEWREIKANYEVRMREILPS